MKPNEGKTIRYCPYHGITHHNNKYMNAGYFADDWRNYPECIKCLSTKSTQ